MYFKTKKVDIESQETDKYLISNLSIKFISQKLESQKYRSKVKFKERNQKPKEFS